MKLRSVCKSKIHHAIVTGADLNYAGSIGIDKALMQLTDIGPGEQVSVWNINNGQRIETYAIELPEGSGQVVVNGAAARHFQPGDAVIIVAFCLADEPVIPQMIVVDEQNKVVEGKGIKGSRAKDRCEGQGATSKGCLREQAPLASARSGTARAKRGTRRLAPWLQIPTP
ncbi:MAG: aspartate 1-decarboxylase [Luteitalea sp.]|nr:aspartate 1-decarboxylase [Luteitalea sp.]